MSAEVIELWLPFPPSANRLWTRTKRGMRRTDEYVAWLLEARLSIKMQRTKALCRPYVLAITAVRPDKRRRDIDNLIKPISDALVHSHIIPDDSLCEMVSARWVTSGDGIGVSVREAGAE